MENLSTTEALWLVLVLVALPFWALNLQFAVRDYLNTGKRTENDDDRC